VPNDSQVIVKQHKQAEISVDLRGRNAVKHAAVHRFLKNTQLEQEQLNYIMEQVAPGMVKSLERLWHLAGNDAALSSSYRHTHSIFPSLATLYNKSTPLHYDSESSIHGQSANSHFLNGPSDFH
jgi:hypothetical protein